MDGYLKSSTLCNNMSMSEPPVEKPGVSEPKPPESKDPLVDNALGIFDRTADRTRKIKLADTEFQTIVSGGV